MGFRCGIVGLPNVGKSTLFNALTGNAISAENYPFCTIDPNVGVVAVPDARLDTLTQLIAPANVVPASLSFVDIAGLVKNAAKGEGLGNQFLAHIRETDAIAHIVRCFDNADIIHVDGNTDPVRDADVIETELILADITTVEKAILRVQKAAKSDPKQRSTVALLEQLSTHLNNGAPARTFSYPDEATHVIRDLHLLTKKPQFFIANIDEDAMKNGNHHLTALREYATAHNTTVIPVCATIETEIALLDPDDTAMFLDEYGLSEPGLHRFVRASYALLGLATFFTAGKKEVRAWTIPTETYAPHAAGVIHDDMRRGFICAEVTGFDDFVAAGNEQKAKELGKTRLEGKEYRIKDGDICHFRFNV